MLSNNLLTTLYHSVITATNAMNAFSAKGDKAQLDRVAAELIFLKSEIEKRVSQPGGVDRTPKSGNVTDTEGILVIDHARGVIWFNAVEGPLAGQCLLRIGALDNPIPHNKQLDFSAGRVECPWALTKKNLRKKEKDRENARKSSAAETFKDVT